MSQVPLPPPILSGDELYDAIMAKIEPELCIANLPNIRELTRNETAEERKVRAARYTEAFEAYDKALQAHVKDWNKAFHAFKTSALKALEHDLVSVEHDDISSLEQSIQAQ